MLLWLGSRMCALKMASGWNNPQEAERCYTIQAHNKSTGLERFDFPCNFGITRRKFDRNALLILLHL